MTDVDTGRIYEGGYRHYDGPRLGPSAAVRSVMRQTMQRVMGLRRPARAKVLPFLSVIMAYLPALVFVGVVALIPKQVGSNFVPEYHDYYGFITGAIVLFVVFTAPEALCPDRRSRVLSLYLAAPLTRTTYLLAKAAAIASILLLVTLGPPLVLLVGRSLQGDGPDGPVAFVTVLARVLASGVVMSLFYTSVSMAVSSLTDRRALAAGGTLLAIIGSNIAAGVFVIALDLGESFFLVNLNVPPIEAVFRIYGRAGGFSSIPTAVVFAAVAVWTAAGAAVTWWRYQHLRVTR